jgi:hypothetical protein
MKPPPGNIGIAEREGQALRRATIPPFLNSIS